MTMRLWLIILIFIYPASWAAKPLSPRGYKTQILVDFKNVIWSFSFINNNEVLISLRKGELYYFNLKTKEKKKDRWEEIDDLYED